MATRTVNIHEAKARLSELLAQALAGDEIVIARANRPVARLVPLDAPQAARVFGQRRGQIAIADDFDLPLPDDFWLGSERG